MHNPRLHPRHATHPTTTPRARVLLFLLVQLDHVVWSQGEGGGGGGGAAKPSSYVNFQRCALL